MWEAATANDDDLSPIRRGDGFSYRVVKISRRRDDYTVCQYRAWSSRAPNGKGEIIGIQFGGKSVETRMSLPKLIVKCKNAIMYVSSARTNRLSPCSATWLERLRFFN